MREKKQTNPRLTLKISKQYPVTSLNGKRFAALRDYFGEDLERHMIQAMWAVLGPLGLTLAELPEKEIQGHINSSKLLIQGFHQEALDMIGGGEAIPEEPDTPKGPGVPAEQAPPPFEDEPMQSEQSGDPLNNLF